MLLNFFKGFQPTNLIIIIFLTTAFWLKVFLDDTSSGIFIDQNSLPLYGIVMDFFVMIDSHFLNKSIALLLILFQAIIVATINNHFNLLGYRSYMPALFFILIIINFTEYLQIHPILFANTLFLIAWIKIKKAQGKQKAQANYFDASMLIGLASLFYFNLIYLIFILWINIIISRPGSIKEFTMAFAGPLVIWYLFFSFYFITNDTCYNILSLFRFDPGFNNFTSLTGTSQIAGIFFLILIILSNMALYRYYVSLNINIRNNLKLFFYLFLLGFLIIYLTNSSLELIFLIAVPVSLFLSLFFIHLKSKLFGNLLLVLSFLITILNLFLADRIV
ncbi:MAG: hypothetical protein ABFS35_08825 [Bacteroidota bacterium]